MKRTAVTGFVVGALLVASGAAKAESPGGVWQARYQEFSGEAKRVRERLGVTYGSSWRPSSLTSEFAREVSWLEGEEARLQWDHSRLVDSAKNLKWDTDLLKQKTRSLKTDHEILDIDLKPLNAEEATLNEQLADNVRRAHIHNSNPPSDDDPAAVARYTEIAAAGNAEQQRLQGELRRVAEAKARIDAKRAALDARAAELASRDQYLTKNIQAFEADAGHFAGRCQEATYRARALAVIAGSKPANLVQGFRRVYEPRPNAVMEVLHSVSQSATVSVLGTLAKRTAGVAGVAITAGELFAPQIGRGGEDVHDRLLLVGDYAAALKRLKHDRYPDEKDPDYRALRHMLDRTGKGMPGNHAEFMAQSTRFSELVKDGLSSLAKGYVVKKVLPDSGQLGKAFPRSEKATVGQYGMWVGDAFRKSFKEGAQEKVGEMTLDQIIQRTAKDYNEAQGRKAAAKGGAR